jgi:hypothetical protein
MNVKLYLPRSEHANLTRKVKFQVTIILEFQSPLLIRPDLNYGQSQFNPDIFFRSPPVIKNVLSIV